MDSSYKSVLDYLHTQLPMFQRVGAPAYKADLSRTQAIMGLVGNPQKQFKSIHVAGTNGKGSICSALAAIFTTCGYRTGLYTSPHLFDFRERMRIDGQMIDRDFVIHFVETIKESTAELRSSYTNFENSFTIVILDGFSYPCHSFTPPPSTPSEPRGSWVSQSLLRFG